MISVYISYLTSDEESHSVPYCPSIQGITTIHQAGALPGSLPGIGLEEAAAPYFCTHGTPPKLPSPSLQHCPLGPTCWSDAECYNQDLEVLEPPLPSDGKEQTSGVSQAHLNHPTLRTWLSVAITSHLPLPAQTLAVLFFFLFFFCQTIPNRSDLFELSLRCPRDLEELSPWRILISLLKADGMKERKKQEARSFSSTTFNQHQPPT